MAQKGLQKGFQETKYAVRNVGLAALVPESAGEKKIDLLIKNNSTMVFYELEGKEPKPVKKENKASFDEEILRKKTGVEAALPMVFVEGRYIGTERDLCELLKKDSQGIGAGHQKVSAKFTRNCVQPVGILSTKESERKSN